MKKKKPKYELNSRFVDNFHDFSNWFANFVDNRRDETSDSSIFKENSRINDPQNLQNQSSNDYNDQFGISTRVRANGVMVLKFLCIIEKMPVLSECFVHH